MTTAEITSAYWGISKTATVPIMKADAMRAVRSLPVMPSALAPVGRPQCVHAAASVEMSCSQSIQLVSAMHARYVAQSHRGGLSSACVYGAWGELLRASARCWA